MKRALYAAALLVACRPDAGDRASFVDTPRIVAIRAEPPEAAPGTLVAYDALVVAPGGSPADPDVAWSYCTLPSTPAENGAVAPVCLDAPGVALTATGAHAEGAIPGDACAIFGPDTPPGSFHAREPDATGGYYQPLRAVLDRDATAIGLERLHCDLADAPSGVASDYAKRYRANQNPRLLGLLLAGANAENARVAPRANVRLVADFASGAAESYVVYDRLAGSLVERREQLRVAWYACGGTFAHDATGESSATRSENSWTAPAESGTVWLWVVLSDDRGGADFAAYPLVVTGGSSP